ncbi:hypothetical protein C8R47DRAFT_1109067, partial [Mycena vitilis]
ATFDDLLKADQAAKRAPVAQRILFLPIFLTHVAPSRTPSLEDRLMGGVLALRNIFHMSVGDAGIDLWPCIWSWVCFVYDALPGFSLFLDLTEPDNFAEIVEGAGGTLKDLASLVLSSARDIVVYRQSWELAPHSFYVRALVIFLQAGDPPRYPQPNAPALQDAFSDTLGACVFVPVLVYVMASFLNYPDADTHESVRLLLALLERLVTTPSWNPCLVGALKAGLLRLLVDCATRFGSYVGHHLRFLLEKLVTHALVYYHVVARMKKVVAKLAHTSSTTEFKALDIYKQWTALTDLCGGMQTAPCRRCSGCETLYHCSQACQVFDWKQGGHCENCASSESSGLLGVHERQFLRALVQREYQDNIRSACEMVAAMAGDHTENGGAEDVEVSAVSEANWPKLGRDWSDFLVRAAKSRRRVQLHMARLPRGDNHATLMLLYDALFNGYIAEQLEAVLPMADLRGVGIH